MQNIIVVPDAFKETRHLSEVCWIKKEVFQELPTTTYRIGELVAQAIGLDIKQVKIQVDHTSIADGGIGAAAALGTVFYNERSKVFIPTQATLKDIKRMDDTYMKALLKKIEITLVYEDEAVLDEGSGILAMASLLEAKLEKAKDVLCKEE